MDKPLSKKTGTPAAEHTIGDVADTIPGWSERTGINESVLRYRIRAKGMTLKDAIAKSKEPEGAPEIIDRTDHLMLNLLASLHDMGFTGDKLINETKRRMVSYE